MLVVLAYCLTTFIFQNGPVLDDNYVITVVITSGQIKYLESAAKIKKAPDSGGLSTWDPAQLLTSIRIWVSCFRALCLSSLSFLKGIVTASEWSYKRSVHAWEGLITTSAPCLHVVLLSCAWLSATLWALYVAHEVPLSMGFPRQVGCHFLLQGIFLTQVSNPHLLVDSFTSDCLGSPTLYVGFNKYYLLFSQFPPLHLLDHFILTLYKTLWTEIHLKEQSSSSSDGLW